MNLCKYSLRCPQKCEINSKVNRSFPFPLTLHSHYANIKFKYLALILSKLNNFFTKRHPGFRPYSVSYFTLLKYQQACSHIWICIQSLAFSTFAVCLESNFLTL